MLKTSKKTILVALSCMTLLGGCTEGTGEDDLTADLSSSGNNCDLAELISEADRSAANACGVQASSQIANADVYYAAAVKACRSGETGTDPDTGNVTTYKDTYEVYKKAANYALTVVGQMNCGTNSTGNTGGGIAVPETSQEQYNLCVGYINDGKKALASCYGPVKQFDYQCGDNRVNYLKSFDLKASCISERDTWLKNAFNN
ncbi:hypothetical protein [Pseudoalteromonas luteoviolacea]|uniref:Lipoprotein n=1 Tax=Pseudoalteromonas luteoviolacea H33 TaxID=1365251 RepID=A0A167E5T9_9GAMM|nr:hypothetical protein [Pseudoalteromonas luteoviolacea]KZN50090.1 hypothetical protein N476_17230 [Pseudoalteromonas luteoviolacea H33]KZN76337.1 hypothetical protein N477_16660 [Pseudoalteromonas luteoviolacea H33-S]MBQ4877732.1 hypothetical protein [Pseudoalteromonas luteoviolacea]MBQ4906822.1 hypothetical protein [Pseudoalteromonas luteoviolacea]